MPKPCPVVLDAAFHLSSQKTLYEGARLTTTLDDIIGPANTIQIVLLILRVVITAFQTISSRSVPIVPLMYDGKLVSLLWARRVGRFVDYPLKKEQHARANIKLLRCVLA